MKSGRVAVLPGTRVDHDHWDPALGPLLIAVAIGPDLGHLPLQPSPLLSGGGPGTAPHSLGADLDDDLRVGLQVEVPLRVMMCSAPGGNHDIVVSLPSIDESGSTQLPSPPTAGRQRVGTPFQR